MNPFFNSALKALVPIAKQVGSVALTGFALSAGANLYRSVGARLFTSDTDTVDVTPEEVSKH